MNLLNDNMYYTFNNDVNKSNYVLMVVPSNFPDGDAGAVRDMAFASIYLQLNYKVILVGRGNTSNSKGIYKNVEYYSVYTVAKNVIQKIRRYFVEGNSYIAKIKKIFNEYGLPSLVHINHVQEFVWKYLYNFTCDKGISFVHDSVEWYSASQFTFGILDKAYILKNRLNVKLIKPPMKVFSISSFLDSYFSDKGIKSLRVPVIMDQNEFVLSERKDNHNKINFIYAGSPGHKDYLREIVLGINSLTAESKSQIEFTIAGISENQLKKLCNINSIDPCFNIKGRISRESVKQLLDISDFSVLLRPSDERYVKAGFPTKVVEAMMSGTAMLCNLTSDLGMYLENRKNAIIIKDCTANSFTKAVDIILNLDRKEIEQLKRNARKTAEEKFDYRLWCKHIKDFLQL